MANMSYCRFQNTVIDLQDCYDVFQGLFYDEDEGLSPNEERAKKRLISLCKGITVEFGEEE